MLVCLCLGCGLDGLNSVNAERHSTKCSALVVGGRCHELPDVQEHHAQGCLRCTRGHLEATKRCRIDHDVCSDQADSSQQGSPKNNHSLDVHVFSGDRVPGGPVAGALISEEEHIKLNTLDDHQVVIPAQTSKFLQAGGTLPDAQAL